VNFGENETWFQFQVWSITARDGIKLTNHSYQHDTIWCTTTSTNVQCMHKKNYRQNNCQSERHYRKL